MKRTAVLCSMFACVITASACVNSAEARLPRRGATVAIDQVERDDISITVEDEWGRSQPTYLHRGEVFVEGQQGARYNLRIHNHLGERIEVVVSVDGRDVVSGALGDYRNHRGYVIDPYGDVVIEGFRKSLDEVAAFRFSSVRDSYSARRGTPQHVGVIGVAVFRERAPVYTPRPHPRHNYYGNEDVAGAHERQSPSSKRGNRETADSASEAMSSLGRAAKSAPGSAPAEPSQLGTEYGESLGSSVYEVGFARAHGTRPNTLIRLFYDSADGLQNRGLAIYREPSCRRCGEPEAFPGAGRFAPPPPPRS